MKRFILPFLVVFSTLFVASVIPKNAQAQITKQVTIPVADSLLTNADTAAISLTFDGSFKSVEVWLEEVSGTTGGKISFQGKMPHSGFTSVPTDWQTIDSLVLEDGAVDQWKLMTVPSTRLHAGYRLLFVKSGTGTARIKAFYVRYTGGWIQRPAPGYEFAYNRRDNHKHLYWLSAPEAIINRRETYKSYRVLSI